MWGDLGHAQQGAALADRASMLSCGFGVVAGLGGLVAAFLVFAHGAGSVSKAGILQQITAASELDGPVAVGEQTEVADPHETPGQDVPQEAAQEFVRLQSHRAVVSAFVVSEGP